MHLAPGTRLGRYEIRSLLGAGGMGEVYLAHDATLRRSVAIKLVPGDLAEDKDRFRRLEQEAYAASSLNHPNILTIHEVGVQDGIHFIATGRPALCRPDAPSRTPISRETRRDSAMTAALHVTQRPSA